MISALTERAVDGVSRTIRRWRIDRSIRRHLPACRLVRDLYRFELDVVVESYDLPDGIGVDVSLPPHSEPDWRHFLVDRHGQLDGIPEDLGGSEFCRRYPTRRHRAPFTVHADRADGDSGAVPSIAQTPTVWTLVAGWWHRSVWRRQPSRRRGDDS